MKTGTIMFDVEINCDSQEAVDNLAIKIEKAVKGLSNEVIDCEQVDTDLTDSCESDE